MEKALNFSVPKYIYIIILIYSWYRGLVGRFSFYLIFQNVWGNTKGKYSPNIFTVITPVICLLQDPRIMTFTFNVLEG